MITHPQKEISADRPEVLELFETVQNYLHVIESGKRVEQSLVRDLETCVINSAIRLFAEYYPINSNDRDDLIVSGKYDLQYID